MAKHEAWELQQMQSLPLSAKIRMSMNRIRGWYDEFQGCVYVARSGGKDSDVLGDIVKILFPDVPQVFVNTGLEFDSVRKHGMEVADVVLQPDMSFVEVITKYGYPIISKEVSQTVTEIQKAIKNGTEPPKYRMDKLNGTCIDKNTGNLSTYNIPQWKFLIDAPFRISHKCCDVMKKIHRRSTKSKVVTSLFSELWLTKADCVNRNGCVLVATHLRKNDLLHNLCRFGLNKIFCST